MKKEINQKKSYRLSEIGDIKIDFGKNSVVFLYGDLGSGKTTLMKHILKNNFGVTESITSPTYTYYNKYLENIYHFDLYRLEKYDEFFAIGGEEILDSGAICFIEWPDVLKKYYEPDITIALEKIDSDEDEREITISYKNT